MTTFAISTVFRGVDQMSGVFSQMANNGTAAFDRIEATAEKRFKAVQGIIKGAAAGFAVAGAGLTAGGLLLADRIGLTDLPEQAMAMQHSLRMLGNIGGLTRKELGGLETELLRIAQATNQMPTEVLGGLQTLVASGWDPRVAVKAMETFGTVATANEAAINDIAQAGFTMFNSMKIPTEGLAYSFDIMAAAASAGKFELKDMARYFPTLTTMMSSLGFKGQEAIGQLSAALQIAQRARPDPSEAATIAKDWLASLTAPRTIKRFQTFGIDIMRVLNKAVREGGDPFVAVTQAFRKATGGNAAKMSAIFTNQESLVFAKQLMADLNDYNTILGDSMKGAGTNMQWFNNIMDTADEQWKKFKISVATTFLPAITPWIERITKMLNKLNEHKNVAKIVGGVAIAMTGLGLALLGVSTGLVAVSAGLALVNAGLLGPVLLIGGAFLAIVVAIAALTISLYAFSDDWAQVWGQVKGVAGDAINWMSDMFGIFMAAVQAAPDALLGAFAAIGGMIMRLVLAPVKVLLWLLSKLPGAVGESAGAALKFYNDTQQGFDDYMASKFSAAGSTYNREAQPFIESRQRAYNSGFGYDMDRSRRDYETDQWFKNREAGVYNSSLGAAEAVKEREIIRSQERSRLDINITGDGADRVQVGGGSTLDKFNLTKTTAPVGGR